MLYPVKRRIERCASNSISCDNETLLFVAIYTPISSFWEGPLQNSVPLSIFSTHLNDFEPLRKHIFLGVKVNTLQFWSRDGIQIFTGDLVLDLLIGRHLILFSSKNFFPEISCMGFLCLIFH